MDRQIVQIAVSSGTDGAADSIYAIANDGTLWQLYNTGGEEWRKLPDLPNTDD